MCIKSATYQVVIVICVQLFWESCLFAFNCQTVFSGRMETAHWIHLDYFCASSISSLQFIFKLTCLLCVSFSALWHCTDAAILALKAFAVKCPKSSKGNNILSIKGAWCQKKLCSEKFIICFMKKQNFCTVQACDVTLKSFYHDGILKLYPCIEGKRPTEVSDWAVLGGIDEARAFGVIISPHCTISLSAGPLWQSTVVMHSEQVAQWRATVASCLSRA